VRKYLIEKYVAPLLPVPTGLKPAGSLSEPLECILFDIYGTLFISGSGDIGVARENMPSAAKLETLLDEYGISRPAETLLADYYQHIDDEHGVLRQKGVDVPEVNIEDIWRRVLAIDEPEHVKNFAAEFEMIVNPVFPMPHLAKVLAALKARSMVIGLISNAQFYTPYLFRWFLDADLAELGFDENLILFSFQVGHAKPSPVLFETAVGNLMDQDIAPSATLYVGNDMLNDIYAAHNCGFQTALFAGDRRSLRLRKQEPRCRDLKPNLVVTDLEQLLKFVR
jgi:putative hydrolase of the HAD superfamily